MCAEPNEVYNKYDLWAGPPAHTVFHLFYCIVWLRCLASSWNAQLGRAHIATQGKHSSLVLVIIDLRSSGVLGLAIATALAPALVMRLDALLLMTFILAFASPLGLLVLRGLRISILIGVP